MESTSEYIEPTTEGRVKMALIAIAIVGGLEAAKRLLIPVFMTHVQTLPKCDQFVWLINSVQAIFFAVPLLLSAFMIPMAIRLLRHKQFPLPGSWVWRRKKVQRGRIVVARAYLILTLCLVTYAFPFWARHVLVKSNAHDECFGTPQAESRQVWPIKQTPRVGFNAKS